MSDSKRFDKVLQKFQEFKEKLAKYDAKRQDGVNVEPPMTAKEKTKKAEFLAMSKHGQWTLGKADDGKSSGSNPPKSENRKRAEKEIREISPTGEDPVKGAEEVDSAEIKRKYRAGQGSGASPNRLHKADEPHKDDPHHEEKELKIADKIKGKAKEFLDMHQGKEEPHEDDPRHEAKEKKEAKDIKSKAEKIKAMHKMDDGTTLAGPYNATGIEKKDLPKDAEYQKHKREVKDRA